jgi:hypothetical protein
VPLHHTLKPSLKRGALVAAANWPVTLLQAVADSVFKLLIAAPLVGGVFLVALVAGAEPGALLALEWRELVATIVTSLLSRPLVLAAFLAALAVVVIGGSLFVFLVKAGTISTLVRGDRAAGPIEEPPLHLDAVARAAAFSIESFIESARAFFPRYARLGLLLMAVYLVSAAVLSAFAFGSRAAGWGATAVFSAAFVAWITIINLLYLLTQIVIAADDCSVAAATSRVAAFLQRERRHVAAVFAVVLALVIFATGASLVATAALGLIGFVPFFGPFLGLAVLPLQLLAWALRALVFQYIGLSSAVAYLTFYRDGAASVTSVSARSRRSVGEGGSREFAAANADLGPVFPPAASFGEARRSPEGSGRQGAS